MLFNSAGTNLVEQKMGRRSKSRQTDVGPPSADLTRLIRPVIRLPANRATATQAHRHYPADNTSRDETHTPLQWGIHSSSMAVRKAVAAYFISVTLNNDEIFLLLLQQLEFGFRLRLHLDSHHLTLSFRLQNHFFLLLLSCDCVHFILTNFCKKKKKNCKKTCSLKMKSENHNKQLPNKT